MNTKELIVLLFVLGQLLNVWFFFWLPDIRRRYYEKKAYNAKLLANTEQLKSDSEELYRAITNK